jgi:hypothetical protein
MACRTAEIQADRVRNAQALGHHYHCHVVLKGITDAYAPDQVKSCTEVEEVDVKWINTQAGKSCTKDYCHAACPFKNVV